MTQQNEPVALRPSDDDMRILRRIRAHAIVALKVDITMSQALRAALNAWETQHPRDITGADNKTTQLRTND